MVHFLILFGFGQPLPSSVFIPGNMNIHGELQSFLRIVYNCIIKHVLVLCSILRLAGLNGDIGINRDVFVYHFKI